MIERAIALQPRLLAEQDETERRSVHSEAIHEEFRRAGFYRCLQPRRFGGYEFDLKTYFRIAIELARGDPSVSWCLIVGSGHALMLGSYFGEEAQAEGFGPDGNFSAPSVAAPTGTATPIDGGWLVKGKWGYASGAPYATHFMPSVLIAEKPDAKPRAGIALVPRVAVENARRLGRDPRHARQRLEFDRYRGRARAEKPRDPARHAQRRRRARDSRLATARQSDVRGPLPLIFPRGTCGDPGGPGLRGDRRVRENHPLENHALSADRAALPASRLSALLRAGARDDERGEAARPERGRGVHGILPARLRWRRSPSPWKKISSLSRA